MNKLSKKDKKNKLHKKIRARVFGTKEKPRLCVFRSASHIYAQLVDDEKGVILVAYSDLKMKSKTKGKIEKSIKVGKEIAKLAVAKKIEKVVFDRGGFRFHGRVKAVAEGAREGGLKF